MRKIIILCLLAIIFSVLLRSNANADGGVFVPPDYYTFEKDQKAFIYYHDGTEDMVISTSYQGNSEDFTWVVPTPTKPEVNKSSASIFSNLDEITNIYSYDSTNRYKTTGLATDLAEPSVQIIEKKNIDIYDTTVLKANSETALSQWMKENGYTFPDDQSYHLSDYTENGWYFVISKIRPELTDSERISSSLASGNITPLRFTFSSNRIIFPMKLTNLANEYQKSTYKKDNDMDWYSPISASLYVLSDHKVSATGFTLSYANWLKPDAIASIVDNATEKDWLNPSNKMFLTRLYSYNTATISEDLIIRNDINNKIYPVPYYQETGYLKDIVLGFFIILLLYLFSPLFLGNIIFKLLSIIKNDSKYFHISHAVATLATLGLLILFPSIVSSRGLFIYSGSFNVHYVIENGAPFGMFISLLVISLLMIFYYIKYFLKKR